MQTGIFRNASPYPLVVSQLPEIEGGEQVMVTGTPMIQSDVRPRPIIIGSIEILDKELRQRCLDLFAQFREGGQHDRLDTVVNEATRILEDRLRFLSSASATCTGVDLAKHAFGQPPALIVSDVAAEQEAAHLLFRGVFGFIRNAVHHRLIETLQPERVLQIVGMVDYLLFVAEGANRESVDTDIK
ncbi:MAG: TIGR02391 family protein [Thermodesulfobacteriota bacterium]